MRDFLREHAGAVVVSVLLHGLLVGGMLLATYISSQTHLPAVQPIPIDAVVVDSQVLHAAQRAQVERAEQEAARARAAAEAKAAQEQAEADARAAAEAEAIAATQEAKQAAKRAEEEADSAARADAAKAAAAEQAKAAQAQRRVDADKASAAAAAQAALDARRAAEAQKSAEARQAADARQATDAKQAADAKRAAEERAKQDREAELRKQLADEERVSAVQSGPLRDRYIALLRNKIQNAWIKPPSATPGVDCLVQVTQVPGGEVTGARVTQCNGDAAVRQSIENAVYRASPLPDPPDPALFERNLSLRFRPNE
ncbi:MAG TPA: cell envelope integrity protein TolA [Steroidobacteraceae bacterium]|nr:cell envelope integrity protein TolA [Steroidobacteraceae bacterium]